MSLKIKNLSVNSRNFALVLLLSALIFVPLFFVDRFALAWRDIIWSGYGDIFVLIWASGIFSLFLSVIYFDLFRQNLRKIYIYLCSAFFCLGVSDISYALGSMHSFEAIWFRCSGFFVFALILVAGFFELWRHEEKVSLKVLWYLLVSGGILILLNILPIVSLDYAVKAYSRSGEITFPYWWLFSLSGILLISFSVPFLKHYLKHWRREDLFTGLFFLCISQLLFASRFLKLWGVLWWLWHVVLLILLLILSLYLLCACVRKSLIWKLILSVMMIFALTIISSFWIVRKYYERRDMKLYTDILAGELASARGRAFAALRAEIATFRSVSKILERSCVEESADVEKFNNILQTCGRLLCKDKYSDLGWISYSEDEFLSCSRQNLSKELYAMIVDTGANLKNGEISLSTFKFKDIDGKGARPLILLVERINQSLRDGYLYYYFDGVFFLKRSLVSDGKIESGKIIYDVKRKKTLYAKHMRGAIQNPETSRELIAAITSLAHDAAKSSRPLTAIERIEGQELVFFAEYEVQSGLLWIDYYIPEHKSDLLAARTHVAASMSAMLIGIITMLLILNRQINRPLQALVRAVLSLQSGNFNIRINSEREDELGFVENAFDQTAERLKILYRNLQENIKEKESALQTLRKIEKEKRDFFNALSHELKNPIHCVLNLARFGMEARISAEEKERYKAIYDRSLQLLEIVEELLQIAKIESVPRREISEFSIRELIQELCLDYSPAAKAKKIKINTVFEPEHFSFEYTSDRSQIKIAISNLISNAIKYTYEGTEVKICLEREPNSYLITVSDEGPGIPQHEIEGLFKEFSYLPGTKQHGSGLGLYISKRIVENEGGMIYAVNRERGGMSFFIRLPVPNEEKD